MVSRRPQRVDTDRMPIAFLIVAFLALAIIAGAGILALRAPNKPSGAATDNTGDPPDPLDGGGETPLLPAGRTGEVIGPAPGSAGEDWRYALKRIRVEFAGEEDPARAAVRYIQCVWHTLAGPDQGASRLVQRVAITFILTDPRATARVQAWEAAWIDRGQPRGDDAVERDALYDRIAGILSGSQSNL